MPTRPVSPEENERRMRAVERHEPMGYGWKKRAADELGLNRSTLGAGLIR